MDFLLTLHTPKTLASLVSPPRRHEHTAGYAIAHPRRESQRMPGELALGPAMIYGSGSEFDALKAQSGRTGPQRLLRGPLQTTWKAGRHGEKQPISDIKVLSREHGFSLPWSLIS